MRVPFALVVLALSGSSLACERGAAEDVWAGAVDTLPNGAVLVSNPAEGMWSPGEEWRIVEELRIGSAYAEGPELFGGIGDVSAGPDGSIWVIESQAQEVRVFDSLGQHVRTLGRKGGGPGEFRGAFGLSWDREGRVWVVDQGNVRYSVYDLEGRHLADHPRPTGGIIPWNGGFDREGFLYDPLPEGIPGGGVRYSFLRLNEAGELVDKLPPLEYRPPTDWLPLGFLAPRLTFTFDAGGHVWLGETDEYRIVKRAFSGDTLIIIDRAYAPAKITAAEEDSLLDWLRMVGLPTGRSELPGEKPVLHRIFLDGDGHVLVKLQAEPEGFDVFDERGRYLGRALTDLRFADFPPPRFLGDRVYGVVSDSLGVPYVVRARIEGHDG